MSQLLRVVSAYHALVGVENISSRTNDALHDRPKLYSTPGMTCSHYGVYPTVYQIQFIIITNIGLCANVTANYITSRGSVELLRSKGELYTLS